MAKGLLFWRKPPPPRTAGQTPTAQFMSNQFYDLRVANKVSQTPDASVIYLDTEGKEEFKFHAGQYITLRVDVDGKEERRAYSLCTSPDETDFGFCVKRLAGGKVSNYLLDDLKAGKTLDVMPPDGRFLAKTEPTQRKTYYLIGAGSGITPLMSIARKVLGDEPGSAVHLLYGNRAEDTIIFREDLDELAMSYRGQFTVSHILSQPARKKVGGLSGLFGKTKPTWEGRIGRVDAQELARFLDEHASRTDANAYYICGPGSMIDTVEKELLRKGVPAKQIHTERFVVAGEEGKEKIDAGAGAKVAVTLDGTTHDIEVSGEKTILETLIDRGVNPPYSCTSGACSTCIAKVTSGEVKMDVNHALDPDEVAEGYCLTCQAHPVTAEVELSYDE